MLGISRALCALCECARAKRGRLDSPGCNFGDAYVEVQALIQELLKGESPKSREEALKIVRPTLGPKAEAYGFTKTGACSFASLFPSGRSMDWR